MLSYSDVQHDHVNEALRRCRSTPVGRFIAPSVERASYVHTLCVRGLANVVALGPDWTEELKRSLKGRLTEWVLDRMGARGLRRLIMRQFVGVMLDVFFDWAIARFREREAPGAMMFAGDVNDTLERWCGDLRTVDAREMN